ncbi:MAG: 50S ribosomal protein L39e [Candidatus Methanomethyliaceae archaeon]|nr:50S ribosomal protein L39e [Candidatus Methanomethyliaceae archaeon]
MARNKHLCRKKRLIHAHKVSSSVPLWVVGKTGGKFRRHPKIRNWRRRKLKL